MPAAHLSSKLAKLPSSLADLPKLETLQLDHTNELDVARAADVALASKTLRCAPVVLLRRQFTFLAFKTTR
jgi:hypothetical protein